MDRHPPTSEATAFARLLGRWVLLGAVIAGILAMHVLSEPAGFDGHAMPAGMASNSDRAAVMHMHAMTAMPATVVAGALVDAHLPAMQSMATAGWASLATNPEKEVAPDPGGMAAMTCCILFLLAGAGLLLVALLRARHRSPELNLGSAALQRFSQRRRGPPRLSALPILLCVLRV